MRELPPPPSLPPTPSPPSPSRTKIIACRIFDGRVNWPRVRWPADSRDAETRSRTGNERPTDRPTHYYYYYCCCYYCLFLSQAKGTQGRRWIGGNPVERFDRAGFPFISLYIYYYEDNIREWKVRRRICKSGRNETQVGGVKGKSIYALYSYFRFRNIDFFSFFFFFSYTRYIGTNGGKYTWIM